MRACRGTTHLFISSCVMFVKVRVVLEMKRQVALTVTINEQYIESQLGKSVCQQIAEGGFANTPCEGEKSNNQSLSRCESRRGVSKSTQCVRTSTRQCLSEGATHALRSLQNLAYPCRPALFCPRLDLTASAAKLEDLVKWFLYRLGPVARSDHP